ncbi:hypothetical protein OY671_003101 [Metschnikowia pulcherrima]|nr:hypothetical protein OY671_003101 [Metschnikowia pulcherrima]
MRPNTFVLSALASLVAAAAVSVTFFAVSSDKYISGPISSVHEGAGTNYFIITKGGSGEKFDLKNGVATTKQGPFLSYVGISGSYLAAGPAVSPSTFRFQGDKIDNYDFWACKNTYDPYLYSSKNHIIVVGKKGNNTAPFRDCKLVKIVKVTTGGPTPSPVIPSPGRQNTTVNTTDITVTDYTTYCPAHTTVTITTCTNHRCAPTTITVTAATTITIKGECLVPTTVTHNVPVTKTVYTTHVTVDGYTTYCPAHTTLTITTCSNHRCAPTTLTVIAGATITIRGECLVPTTVTRTVPVTKTSTVYTSHVTVNGYTTYCPASTVVTVTLCNLKCAPRFITVTRATTLTVTGDVLVPTTVTSVFSSTPYTGSANSSFSSISPSRSLTSLSITT